MARTRSLKATGPNTGSAIGRRQAVEALLAGAGAGLVIPGLAKGHPLGEHAHHPERIADAQERAHEPAATPRFLEPYAFALTESLGERIVPGAAGAGCALFIDQLLTVGAQEERQRFVTALGAIDGAARDTFGAPWPKLDEAQQTELLTTLSTSRPGRGEAPRPHVRSLDDLLEPPGGETPVTLRDRFDYLKGWVMGAYYTSEEGLRELGYDGPVFADEFPGCPHPDGHR